MHIRTLLLCLIGVPLFSSAQQTGQQAVDSLRGQLPLAGNDSERVTLLYTLARTSMSINTDTSLRYGMAALALSKKIKWSTRVAKSSTLVGLLYLNQGNDDLALRYFDSGLVLSQQVKDTANWTMSMMDEGVVYNTTGDYPKAMQLFMKCLPVDEARGDTLDAGRCLQNIGNVFMKLGNLPKALDYFGQAYAKNLSIHDQQGMALAMYGLGQTSAQMNDDSAAIGYLQKALHINEAIADKRGMAQDLNSIGLIYQGQDNIPLALLHYRRALQAAQALGDLTEVAFIGQNIGGTYLQAVINNDLETLTHEEGNQVLSRKRFLDSSRIYITRSLLFNKSNANWDGLKGAYLIMSQIDSVAGDYKDALGAYRDYIAIRDSIFNNDNRLKVQQLENQRMVEVRDNQIRIGELEIRNQKNQRRWYIGFLGLLGVVLGLLFWQSNTRRKTNRQLKTLNGQLNESNRIKARFFSIFGHDLRSPLSNLVNFLDLEAMAPDMMQEPGLPERRAKIRHSAENLLLTMEDLLLWGKDQMHNSKPHPSIFPVGRLFQEIQQLYPGDQGLTIGYTYPEALELTTDEDYLKTILRNLTGNAVKALKGRSGGRISWKAWQQDDKTFLSITDNGPGLSADQQEALLHEDTPGKNEDTPGNHRNNGLGLPLIGDLAAAIHCSIGLTSEPDVGTTFTLTI